MSGSPVFTLHRYFIWGNHMRHLHDEHLKGEWQEDKNSYDVVLHNLCSYWYGGLYVVIEGWRDLKLSDPEIDKLLQSRNVDLLRRYRNGVFHFQKEYFDKRFTELWEESSKNRDFVP